MAVQTPVHVSLLSKLLTYFELAASIGAVIPEPHVAAISALIEQLSADLLSNPLINPQVKVTTGTVGSQPPGTPVTAARSNVTPNAQAVKSTF